MRKAHSFAEWFLIEQVLNFGEQCSKTWYVQVPYFSPQ